MTRNKRRVNAKCIMGVMMLAAGKGASVTIEVDGARRGGMLRAILQQLIQADKFGESE